MSVVVFRPVSSSSTRPLAISRAGAVHAIHPDRGQSPLNPPIDGVTRLSRLGLIQRDGGGVAERDPAEVRFNQALAERLKYARSAAGLTQTQLAARVDLTRGSIANMERGEQSPTPFRLASIALVLGCDVADLIPSPSEWGGISRSVAPVRQNVVEQVLRKAEQQRRRADG